MIRSFAAFCFLLAIFLYFSDILLPVFAGKIAQVFQNDDSARQVRSILDMSRYDYGSGEGSGSEGQSGMNYGESGMELGSNFDTFSGESVGSGDMDASGTLDLEYTRRFIRMKRKIDSLEEMEDGTSNGIASNFVSYFSSFFVRFGEFICDEFWIQSCGSNSTTCNCDEYECTCG